MKILIATFFLLISAVSSADEFRSYVEYKNQLNYADQIHVLTQHRFHYGIETSRFYAEFGFIQHDFDSGISSEIGVTWYENDRWNIGMNWEGVKFDNYLDHNLETEIRLYFN